MGENIDRRDSAAPLVDSDLLPVWRDKDSSTNNTNLKLTALQLIEYFLSTTRAGSFSGTFGGDVTADMLFLGPGDEMTASGAVSGGSFVNLNHATVSIAATVTPSAGQLLIITQKDAGTVGHTLTTAGTFDGTNNTATFNAQYETLVLFALSSTRWIIIGNFGSVALSAV
jgi:hypothetical protein